MNIQEINQRKQFDSISKSSSENASLDQIMSLGMSKSENAAREEPLGRHIEFSQRIFDGAPKTKKDVLAILTSMKEADGKASFRGAADMQRGLIYAIDEMNAGDYDPALDSALNQTFIYCIELENQLMKRVDAIINGTPENGGSNEDPDDR